MTVSSITPVNNYAGNGTNKTFDFDFPIENSDELVVTHISSDGTRNVLTCDLDYTIDVITDNDNNFVSYGQNITFPIGSSSYGTLGEDEKISLALNLTIEQQKEMKNSNKLNLSTLEWCLDYLTRLIQILNRKIERSIKVQEGSNITTDILVGNLNKVADNSNDISTVANNISVITSVNTNATNINSVASDLANINSVALDLSNIDMASDYSNNANIWAEGTDAQVQALGGVHSSKGWAQESSSGQVQTDWSEADNTSKAYIKNKPTKLTDFTNDLPSATSVSKGIVQVDGTTITSDANGVITSNVDVSNKADVSLSNANNQAKILMSGMSVPSDTYDNLTLGASGSTYSAPANGWFYFARSTTAVGKYIQLSSGNLTVRSYGPANGDWLGVYLPVKKNDTVTASYSQNTSADTFRFYYAVGSESEA